MNENKKAALLRQKIEIEDRLSRLKTRLQKAKMLASSKRIYMDPDEFFKLAKFTNLKRESQFLQLDAARQLLPSETFSQILSMASVERDSKKRHEQ